MDLAEQLYGVALLLCLALLLTYWIYLGLILLFAKRDQKRDHGAYIQSCIDSNEAFYEQVDPQHPVAVHDLIPSQTIKKPKTVRWADPETTTLLTHFD